MSVYQSGPNRVRTAQTLGRLKKQAEAIGIYILKTYLEQRQATGSGEMEFVIKVHEANGQVTFDVNEAQDESQS